MGEGRKKGVLFGVNLESNSVIYHGPLVKPTLKRPGLQITRPDYEFIVLCECFIF